MTSASHNVAGLVEDILLDAGCGQDTELRGALLSLGSLASLPAPAPTGELAALLTAGGPSPGEAAVPAGQLAEDAAGQLDEQPDDELARRRRRRHRPTALGLVLVAGMGLGVGGVAASSVPSGSSAMEQVLEGWAPWSGPATEPSAAGSGYRAPKVASDAELAAAGSPAAPGEATGAANLASRLLRDPAGSSPHTGQGHGGTPACAGPVKHGSANAARKCAAAGDELQDGGAGNGKQDTGATAEGTQAGAEGTAKAGTPGPNTPPAAAETAGAAQKAAGSAANAEPAPAQGQTGAQGAGQGNGLKPTSPAK